MLWSVSPAEGATSGFGNKIHHAWSQSRGLLAIVNNRNEAIVVQRQEDGSLKQLLREQLPEAPVISCSWDPSSQSTLAIAIRHYGIALWDTKGDLGVQMWSGMTYKNALLPLRKAAQRHEEAAEHAMRKPPHLAAQAAQRRPAA